MFEPVGFDLIKLANVERLNTFFGFFSMDFSQHAVGAERLVLATIRLRSALHLRGTRWHHVFVWEGPRSRGRRAERRHSWRVQGSRAATFVDYTSASCY